MRTLVPIELLNGRPTQASLGVLERMQLAGQEAWALVFGDEQAAHEVARFRCAGVLLAEGDQFSTPAPAPRAALVAKLVSERNFSLVVLASSVLATELAALVAVACDAGVQWGLTDLATSTDGVRAERSTHADAMRTTGEWTQLPAVALFRPYECAPGDPTDTSAAIERIAAPERVTANDVTVEFLPVQEASGRSLSSADIIVSGGRGLRGPEELDLVRDLADALGGMVGVSLPLVDMGWAPRSMQVGQTGTVVSPRLYIACGISGQIQHKLGIEKSGTIIAVNTDKDAPIMKFCDLGIVGDLRTILPPLAAAIRASQPN